MKTIVKIIKVSLWIVSITFLTACNEKQKSTTMNTQDNAAIFPKGQQLPDKWFSGEAYLQPLLGKDKNNDYALGSVTFEAGARTHWHTHPKGQVLIVTDGEGFYQEKGKMAQCIKKGDIVNIPEDVEHWHGAAASTGMTHIAITNYRGEENVTWLKPVTDEEFNEVNQ